MRGRNNNNNNNNNGGNNRKGPNPLTRNYESNGPDVKIRGSAQQIAEKYTTLARDSMSAGDRVIAENYLQHAEHYNRIIAAAQAQLQQQQPQFNRDDIDDDMDDDGDELSPMEFQSQQPIVANGSGPQPVIDGTPVEVALAQPQPGEQPQATGGRERRPNGLQNGSTPEAGDENFRRSRRQRGRRGRPDYANGEPGEGEGVNGNEAEGGRAAVNGPDVSGDTGPQAAVDEAPAQKDEAVAQD
jgi:hypothetical protein